MEQLDAAAVTRAQSGDQDAFRALVELHGRNVFRLAFRMTGNEEDAEDIVQETFLRAYRQLGQYESRSTFGSWLYRIAANCAVDSLRVRKASGAAGAFEGAEEFVAANAPGPDRLAASSQTRERVSQAMAGLTAMERTSFVLRHFEGLSMDEIGNALGVSTSSAKQGVFRAVQKLRAVLAPLMEA